MGENFEFNDKKGKGEKPGVEASLDDFFQPTEQEAAKKAAPKAAKPAKEPKEAKETKEAKPSKEAKAAKKEEKLLPIDKSKVGELKDEPEVAVTDEAASESEEAGEEPKKAKSKKLKVKKDKAEGTSKALPIIIGVVVVAVLVLAAAGYFAYNKFFKKTEQVAITMPPKKPKPVPPPAVTGPAVPAPTQPAPTTPPGKPGKQTQPAKPGARRLQQNPRHWRQLLRRQNQRLCPLQPSPVRLRPQSRLRCLLPNRLLVRLQSQLLRRQRPQNQLRSR